MAHPGGLCSAEMQSRQLHAKYESPFVNQVRANTKEQDGAHVHTRTPQAFIFNPWKHIFWATSERETNEQYIYLCNL